MGENVRRLVIGNICGDWGARLAGSGAHPEEVEACLDAMNRMKDGVEACYQKAVKEPLVEQAFVRTLNKAVDGDFAEQMVRNIRDGLDAEDYGAELARIDEQLVGLQKELMTIARMNVREGIDGGVYFEEHRTLSRRLRDYGRRGMRSKRRS